MKILFTTKHKFYCYQFIRSYYKIFVVLLILFPSKYSFAADSLRSYVFKNRPPDISSFTIKRQDDAERLWDVFLLIRDANSGNSIAQHELGLRYLMGKDFIPDTVKALYWIKKAADKNLLSARYNLGILLYNGWGIDWNPFTAYAHFQYAAQHGMAEAGYVYGLLLTDNLIVPRNYKDAYQWIKIAADSGYAPAKEVLTEFDRRGILSFANTQPEDNTTGPDSLKSQLHSRVKSAVQPVFVNVISESKWKPDDPMLWQETLNNNDIDTSNIGNKAAIDLSRVLNDSMAFKSIFDAADYGSPEAFTFLGRLYEQGIVVKKDILQAAIFYIRAIRCDSPWAPLFLWEVIKDTYFFEQLKSRVDMNDPAACFVWAELIALGFDHQLTQTQACELLQKSAANKFPDALLQLGMFHYSGFWVPEDKEEAVRLLEQARQHGNKEADIRLCMIKLKYDSTGQTPKLLDFLHQSAQKGSVLAEAALGYSYQVGKGVVLNKTESVQWYRQAARRGSKVAYSALKEMYDSLRPKEIEFQVQDSE
jgi:TPR repeat protein